VTARVGVVVIVRAVAVRLHIHLVLVVNVCKIGPGASSARLQNIAFRKRIRRPKGGITLLAIVKCIVTLGRSPTVSIQSNYIVFAPGLSRELQPCPGVSLSGPSSIGWCITNCYRTNSNLYVASIAISNNKRRVVN